MITAIDKFPRDDRLPTVRIEEMEPEDLEDILAIECASFPTPWSQNIFLKELHHPLSRNLSAKIKGSCGDEIAGYMIYWLVADEVHLQHIAVRDDLRRSGIASLLCRRMMESAYKEGALHATLEVRRSNAAAVKLYEKFSFLVKGVRPGYYDDTHEDALIMWAEIQESIGRIHDDCL
ncbi:MAG: ribosomal protein S18-alanine N-acetyltransferase [Deltaproteobacteria bacterium]|nr:ribosomal protein S18-alanine N-acetyltransferase [Deltaproteobacteria bacterium]